MRTEHDEKPNPQRSAFLNPTKSLVPLRPLPGANAVIFGRKGSGKTTLAKNLLQGQSRCLIVDPLDEYSSAAIGVGSFDELRDYLDQTEGQWKIAYHNDRLNEDFELLCQVAYTLGDCLFVVEEADWFCSPVDLPEELERLIKYGRHQNTLPLALSRRPAEMHRMFTSMAYEVYCFTTQEPRDLDYLSKLVSKDFAEGLADLPPLTYKYQDLWDRTKPPQVLTVSLP